MKRGTLPALLLLTVAAAVLSPARGTAQVVRPRSQQLVAMIPCKYETTAEGQIRKALFQLDRGGFLDAWRRYDWARTMSGLDAPYTVTKVAIEVPDCRRVTAAGDSVDYIKVFTITRELSVEDPIGPNSFEANRLDFDYTGREGGLRFLTFDQVTYGMQKVR